MRRYKIIYCFLDKNNAIETDEQGEEKYFDEIIEAYNGGEAIDKFKAQKFASKPEIINIAEAQEYERTF